MKQVLQDLSTGSVTVMDVPDLQQHPGMVLVRTEASVVSAGTEAAQLSRDGRSLVGRIIDNPQLIRKGWETLAREGAGAVRQRVASKYAGYAALGYSAAGRVVASGSTHALGSRVACAGVGYANHAELIAVPERLCVTVPEQVAAEDAAYTALGAIAMHGVRLASASLGEYVVVLGLGVVGLLTVQLLKAAGCTVLGIDIAPGARARGSLCDAVCSPDEAPGRLQALSRGVGADAVLICAATDSKEPIQLAGELARSRGRVVMVGVAGMELPRELYFRKEITFLVSRSYGPGRYDASYEEHGIDYPVDYVRFTEERNMQAFIELVAAGRLRPGDVTTHRFPVGQAAQAYAVLNNREIDRAGLVITYPASAAAPMPVVTTGTIRRKGAQGAPGISFIGAGHYARTVLLPLIKRNGGANLRGVATRMGEHAMSAAREFGFAFAASGPGQVIADAETQAVFIATRHDTHAALACDAIRAGKYVWVEKPLCLTLREFREVQGACAQGRTNLAVGFNRRFSPLGKLVREHLDADTPRMMTYRVNAGMLPANHWTQDAATGGGRLLGEGCHFFDYLCWMSASEPVRVSVEGLGGGRPDLPAASNFQAVVTFRNGSVGHVIYSSQGSPRMPKERFEIFCGSIAAAVDDHRRAEIHTSKRTIVKELTRQDKGQHAMIDAFLRAVGEGGETPVPFGELMQSTLLTLAAQMSLEQGAPVDLARLQESPTA